MESQTFEKKSLKIIESSTGFDKLAETAVCLANSKGGTLCIGIDDKSNEPANDQRISVDVLNNVVNALRTRTYSVAVLIHEIVKHENGGEFIKLTIGASQQTISATTKGKILMRVGDQCQPVHPNELARLIEDRGHFQWETKLTRTGIDSTNESNIMSFCNKMRSEGKLSSFVSHKNDIELLEYFGMAVDNKLTNLGVVWCGTPTQRLNISYHPLLQYIVYDQYGNKIRKYTWDDCLLNPAQIIDDIEIKCPELYYSKELPDGMFRKFIPIYPPEVIRELLVNAFAHRVYTTASPITIAVYPEKIIISSPGSLPVGVTPENILHTSIRRNPNLVRILSALGYMEGEGSGYDTVYSSLSKNGAAFPTIENSFNDVAVELQATIIDDSLIALLDYVSTRFNLPSKALIAFGVIAREQRVLVTALSKLLQLKDDQRLREWTQPLIMENLVVTTGARKGTSYLVRPQLYAEAKLNVRPSLKTMEDHRLSALVLEDLRRYPGATPKQVHTRLVDVPLDKVKKALYALVEDGSAVREGSTKGTRYALAKKTNNS